MPLTSSMNKALPSQPIRHPGRRGFLRSAAACAAGIAAAPGCGGGGGGASDPPTRATEAPKDPSGPAPGPSGLGEVVMQPVDAARLIEFTAFHRDSRYERFQRLLVLQGTQAAVEFQAYNLASGGTANAFGSPRYTLLVDGREAAAATVSATSHRGRFELDTTALQPGWRQIDIGGLAAGETCPTSYAYVLRGEPVAEYLPVVRGSFELAQGGNLPHMHVRLPARYAPQARPLVKKRRFEPFDRPLTRADLHCDHLVPLRMGDVHRPNRNAAGVVSSFDAQVYGFPALRAAKPLVALLDGPRGVGTVSYVTHVSLSNAAPDGVPRHNTYFCDPWRVGKISPDGTITTLAGWRHRGMLSHWEDPDSSFDLELVGDWSRVPAARRGFHELWGMAWDERTLTIDETAARIAAENNEQPHLQGPVMFLADSQRSRIAKLEFSAVAHGVPPLVSEFVTALSDPWDLVCAGGRLYVSERQAHRIAVYDAGSGALLQVLLQGRPLARIDADRTMHITDSLDAVRREPCVAPEGLFLHDGWLYFASKAQGQVRRLRLADGRLEVVCDVPMNDNTKFMKIAVGDGSFGPRGTVFVWSWNNAWYGYPTMWLPDGRGWSSWWPQSGGSGNWADHFNYATAGAVAHGRMVIGGANEGLLQISRREPDDPPVNAAAAVGRNAYYARGLHLVHGHNGFGFHGLPLPWGQTAEIDAFLTLAGHRRVGA